MCNTGGFIALREGNDAGDYLTGRADICDATTVVMSDQKATTEVVHCAGENRFTDGIVILINLGEKLEIDVIVA